MSPLSYSTIFFFCCCRVAKRRFRLATTQRLDTHSTDGSRSRQYLQEQHGHVHLCWHVWNETAGQRGRLTERSLPPSAKVSQQRRFTLLQLLPGAAARCFIISYFGLFYLLIAFVFTYNFLLIGLEDSFLLPFVRTSYRWLGGARCRGGSALRSR